MKQNDKLWVCPDCNKEFKGPGNHPAKHGKKKLNVWNKGLTKKELPQMKNSGSKKGHNKGHKNFFTTGHTAETKEKIAQASKKMWENPETYDKMFGPNRKKHYWSEESKQKVSESIKNWIQENPEEHQEYAKLGAEAIKEHYKILRQYGEIQDDYPIEWNKELKRKIKDRDNWTCQDCGVTQNQLTKDGKWLIVHHLDGDKDNLDENNLITLCRPCHTYFHHVDNKHIVIRD